MGFFDKIFGTQRQKKRTFEHIKRGLDPYSEWDQLEKLGDGAFGDVFKVRNKVRRDYAAAKVIELGNEEEMEEHYNEIAILAKINHPSIVKLVDGIFYEKKLWILIEYCEGGALDDIMEKLDHGLNEEQIQLVSRQTLEALNYCHSIGVIHRDLKAGNILLMKDGSVKLTDFGVSALNDNVEQMRETFIGTPYWMAPEVIMCETRNTDPYTYSADVWSFGITIIELVEIEPPNNDLNPQRVLMKIARSNPPTLQDAKSFSAAMNSFLALCLKKAPLERAKCVDLLQHSWLQDLGNNKPLRQLLAEARAEVLTEVIKQDANSPASVSKSTRKNSVGSMSSLSSEEESPEVQPSKYEKAIHQKFNSVSDTNSEMSPSTVPPTPSSSGVSEIDVIAPHPSPVKKRPTPPPDHANDSSGARKSVSNSAPTSRSSSFKMKTADIQPISPSGAKGTWFGTSKSLARANPQSAEGIGEMFKEEIKKEDEALEMLDNVLMSEQEKDQRAESKDAYSAGKPTKPVQRGAARESYRNATAEEKPVIHTSTERSVKEEGQETLQYEKKVPTKTEMKKKTELTHEEKLKRQKKTLKKTRKFIVDGEEVTITSMVTVSDHDVEQESKKRIFRRQELQDLRKLQIEEQRKMANLNMRLAAQTEQLETKHDRETADLAKIYQTKIDSLEKTQKSKIEKMESSQAKEQKEMQNQSHAHSELKRQVTAQFSDRKARTETLRARKQELNSHQKYKESAFKAKQEDKLKEAITKYSENQKKTVAETERQFLDQKQEALLAREKAMWDLEEKHFQEKHQVAKSQLKDQFLLQKMLLMARHDKEMEQMIEHNDRLIKALQERQRLEKLKLPKWQRNDAKTRENMFKQSIRIQNPAILDKEINEKLKDFKHSEDKRQRNEKTRQEDKHDRQLRELHTKCENYISEMKQIQSEKKRLLVETEAQKLKALDENFKKKFEYWRSQLVPRKQELDEQFARQKAEWEQFFSQQDIPNTPSSSKRLSNFYR
ncbi:Oidioi.mRNA.OKI2018_I69.chr2.g7129.t1.cds [Oikopleura dioica]|uniref:Oidioi.mRNA.OKI2018_I69.chr2.g7129.t1.cds n=1 Tax=Oikopleura dioica TaxID=34765 RepID=A0ABN7T9Z8_OIKDI|nr:Oidioi.mRNA.OKI2018_I69.chr2.g7129.t1.cds [Oikopleura dioica]